jgi:hypothetical protein
VYRVPRGRGLSHRVGIYVILLPQGQVLELGRRWVVTPPFSNFDLQDFNIDSLRGVTIHQIMHASFRLRILALVAFVNLVSCDLHRFDNFVQSVEV